MKRLITSLILLPTILISLGWLWLIIGGVTWQTVVMGSWGLVATLIPLSAWLGWREKRPFFQNATSVQLSLILLLGLMILWQTPAQQTAENSPVSHQFVGVERDEHLLRRFSLSNIVPEKEQINLGFRLMPFVDPFLTREQVRQVSGFTWALYDNMESDPHFRAMGSVLGFAYSDLLQRPSPAQHYFLYEPYSLEDSKTPQPAILFLHGSGGNFKTYLWVWAQFAEEHGYIIVAPSYGFGNWDRELGVTAVQATLADAVQKANIDPNRVILAGLSNGGFGATRVAEQFPDAYQGVILLSPGIDGQSIDNQAYAEGWNGRSHLIITGEQDKRIPVGYVNGRSQQLQNIGVDVTLHTFPKEDHFLFYSQPDDVMHLIAEWLE